MSTSRNIACQTICLLGFQLRGSAHRRCLLEPSNLPFIPSSGIFDRQGREFLREPGNNAISVFLGPRGVYFFGNRRHVAEIDGTFARNEVDGECGLEKGFIPTWEGSPSRGRLNITVRSPSRGMKCGNEAIPQTESEYNAEFCLHVPKLSGSIPT